MTTSSVTSATDAGAATNTNRAAVALGSDDFFKLLITQLTNQDPLEPTSNQELLDQISSIRQIELSTNLSDSLKSLTEQQRFSSVSSLIGRYVTGQGQTDGGVSQPVQGIVKAVRFDADGHITLDLDDGSQLPLEQLGAVMDASQAAEVFVGMNVSGIDRSDPANPRYVEGLVTGATQDQAGNVWLELDTGEAIALADVMDSRSAQDDSDGSVAA